MLILAAESAISGLAGPIQRNESIIGEIKSCNHSVVLRGILSKSQDCESLCLRQPGGWY